MWIEVSNVLYFFVMLGLSFLKGVSGPSEYLVQISIDLAFSTLGVFESMSYFLVHSFLA
jgi:hypothetical protein